MGTTMCPRCKYSHIKSFWDLKASVHELFGDVVYFFRLLFQVWKEKKSPSTGTQNSCGLSISMWLNLHKWANLSFKFQKRKKNKNKKTPIIGFCNRYFFKQHSSSRSFFLVFLHPILFYLCVWTWGANVFKGKHQINHTDKKNKQQHSWNSSKDNNMMVFMSPRLSL